MGLYRITCTRFAHREIKKYNLLTPNEAKTKIVEKYKIEWEDGTIEEWEKTERK